MNRCVECDYPVAPIKKEGEFYCMPCVRAGKAVPRPKILIDVSDLAQHEIKVAPVSYLKTHFEAYRDTVSSAGLQYLKDQQANYGKAASVPILLDGLRANGLTPVVTKDISDQLAALHDAMKASVAESVDLLDEIERHTIPAHGKRFFPYQRYGVMWIRARWTHHWGAILNDQMGLGKTVQALGAVPRGAPLVIVVPRIARSVWKAHLAEWRPEYEVFPVQGRQGFFWPKPNQAVIVHWEIMPAVDRHDPVDLGPGHTLLEDLCYRPPGISVDQSACFEGTVLIGDEIHAFKNKGAVRTRRWWAMARWVRDRGGKVLGMTGTLMLNSPPELWTNLDNLGMAQEVFGNWYHFAELCGGYKDFDGHWAWDPDAVDPAVPDMVKRCVLRRERREVMPDLPEKIYREILVPIARPGAAPEGELGLGEGATANPLEAADLMLDALETQEGRSIEEIAKDPDYLLGLLFSADTHFMTARRVLSIAKLEMLESIVADFEQEDEPVVVFSSFRAPIDLLHLRDGWEAIKGGQTDAIRESVEAQFQEGELKGLACMIQSAGVALTLTRAAHAIFVDETYVPGENVQAQDRLCRHGQTRGVVIHRLVADHPLDRAVARALEFKEKLIDAAMGRVTVPVRDVTTEILADIEAAARGVVVVPNETREKVVRTVSRGPVNTMELWAARVLRVLAGEIALAHAATDEDRADTLFVDRDKEFGLSLIVQLNKRGTLSPKQWPWVVKIARKPAYREHWPEDPPTRLVLLEPGWSEGMETWAWLKFENKGGETGTLEMDEVPF